MLIKFKCSVLGAEYLFFPLSQFKSYFNNLHRNRRLFSELTCKADALVQNCYVPLELFREKTDFGHRIPLPGKLAFGRDAKHSSFAILLPIKILSGVGSKWL